MKTMNKLVAFTAMAMLSVSALADKEPQPGFYLSPEIGSVTLKNYCKLIRSSDPQATCSESEIGFGLLGGYQLTDFVAVEAGFRSVSGFDASLGNLKFDVDYNGFSLGGAYRIPIGEDFAITGKVGYHFWDAEFNVNGIPNAVLSSDGSDPYLGIGLESIFGNISLRSEYTRYKLVNLDDDADVISVRLVISF